MTTETYAIVYVGGYNTEAMVRVEPFYVSIDNPLETSQTPREGFEMHPAFRTLQEIRDGIDWGEY